MHDIHSALTLPAVIKALRRQVVEDMAPGSVDESGHEVLQTLDVAWVAAARWREEVAAPGQPPHGVQS